jgi:PAS domain S-box-containing protein
MQKARTLAPSTIGLGLPGLNAAMALTAVLLACCASSSALDPSLDISQYAHTSWKIGEGVANDTTHTIVQTKDGYLWLATESGLRRFDGVRAVPWQPPPGEHLPGREVRDLHVSRDGTLWIGTDKGLASWKDGELTNYPQLDGYDVPTLAEDKDGTVWAAGLKWEHAFWEPGRLCAINAGKVQCMGSDGIFGFGVTQIHEDGRGNFWLGAANGIWRWKPGPPVRYPFQAGILGSPTLVFSRNSIIDGDHGGLIVARYRDIVQFTDGKTEPYSFPYPPPPFKNTTLLRDKDGGLWISSTDVGLAHVHQGRMDFFTDRDGLTSNSIEGMFEDREGSIWVATNRGIDRFRENTIPTISTGQGLSSRVVLCVLAARDGSVWLGTSDGLNRWKDGRITIYRKATVRASGNSKPSLGGRVREVISKDLPENFIISLLEDRKGRIWFSTARGLAYFENDKISRVAGLPFAPQNPLVEDTAGNLWTAQGDRGLVRLKEGKLAEQIPWTKLGIGGALANPLAADPQGGVWVGSWGGGVIQFRDGQVRASYSTREGLGGGRVNSLQFDSNGRLWAATDGGLSLIRNGRAITLTSKNGLPCDSTHDVLEENSRAFWVHMACGLVRIERGDLDGWSANPAQRVQSTIYDASDGVLSHAGVYNFGPRATKTADGKLWFTPVDGVMVVDPHHLPSNPLAPPVDIEQIKGDGKILWQNLSEGEARKVPVPALTRSLEIDYTGLSFVAPEKVRFKYKLEGYDADWQDADVRRQAIYTNLAPRSYRFRVIACNNSGVWNEAGDALEFAILPAWFQTIWFRALCVAAFLALLWAIYQRRIYEIEEQEKKFREAVETMPALAFVSEPEGKRPFVNRGWLEYTGLSAEKSSGDGWEQAIHPDDNKRVLERWRGAQAKGELLAYECRIRRGSDGAYRWFQTRARPLLDRHGKIVKWCAVATDIEDRKRAEQLQADLAHVGRVSTMGELAASISHELNQPIAASILNASLALQYLERNPPDLTEARKQTSSIIEMGTMASAIIDRLRSLYKKEPPKREPLGVNAVIGEMVELLRGQATRRAVSLRSDLASELPNVIADRVQVQQVLMNLMLNGIEAMSDTGGVLTVRSQLREDGQIEISVNDTGPGLPAGKADQIFDAFFTTKPQGSGMGLAISKTIVESHGGRIWANGAGGLGAAFHFTLPLAPVEVDIPILEK